MSALPAAGDTAEDAAGRDRHPAPPVRTAGVGNKAPSPGAGLSRTHPCPPSSPRSAPGPQASAVTPSKPEAVGGEIRMNTRADRALAALRAHRP
ncbi:hypothetical protein STENM327S_03723 [Streptomyces tendae]